MQYIGIDIGKRFHVACVLDDTNTFTKHLKFSSLGVGYEKFMEYLKVHEVTKEHSIIGLEATGHYWLTLFQKLKAHGWKVYVLNPLQVQSFRNEKIRGSKTDDLDCELIAKVIKFGVGCESALPSEELFQLKQLSRFRWDLVQRLSSIKLEVISVLDTVFPEYETVFKGLFGKTSIVILSEYTMPDEIASLDVEKLTLLLEKKSRKKFGRKIAVKLQQTARDTFGLRFGMSAFSLELKLLLSQIRHLQKQKETVETTITKLVKKQKTTLVTIPGIGYIAAGTILGETVGFYKKQEKDPRSLLAFAGLDPVLKQSGQFSGKTKMSKRGSSYLRYALMQSALVAANCDEGFKKIYQKYKGQGKHHRVALSHVATKLTFVVHSVMRTNKAYVPLLEHNKQKS
jgi:transposase